MEGRGQPVRLRIVAHQGCAEGVGSDGMIAGQQGIGDEILFRAITPLLAALTGQGIEDVEGRVENPPISASMYGIRTRWW
jgi:hypothetical protein